MTFTARSGGVKVVLNLTYSALKTNEPCGIWKIHLDGGFLWEFISIFKLERIEDLNKHEVLSRCELQT